MGCEKALAALAPVAAAALHFLSGDGHTEDERRIFSARLTTQCLIGERQEFVASTPGGTAVDLASNFYRMAEPHTEGHLRGFQSAGATAAAQTSCRLQDFGLNASPAGDAAAAECRRRGLAQPALLAAQYAAELQYLRQRLKEEGVVLPASRFGPDGAELMRFAVTMGLCSASSPSERQHAMDLAAERIAETADWLATHEFFPAEQLPKWKHLLRWRDGGAEGQPLLEIELGQATRECRGAEMDEFAEAIISQVQLALDTMLSDEPGEPHQIIVVCNSAGASTRQASHVLKLIQHVSLALNRYYPGRLHCFYLVDLPAMIRWPVQAIVALGHPSTRSKVVLCSSSDPRLQAALASS